MKVISTSIERPPGDQSLWWRQTGGAAEAGPRRRDGRGDDREQDELRTAWAVRGDGRACHHSRRLVANYCRTSEKAKAEMRELIRGRAERSAGASTWRLGGSWRQS